MTKLKNTMIFMAIFFVLLNVVEATLDVALSDQATNVKVKSTNGLVTLGNLTIEVWDAPTGGNMIYAHNFTNKIINGAWNVMIGEEVALSLNYGAKYYKEYKINDEDVDFTNATGNTVERLFWYSPLGEIGGEDIDESSMSLSNFAVTGDINMGEYGILSASTNWQPIDEGLVLEMPFSSNTYVNTTLTLDSSGEQNDGTVVNAIFNSSGGFDNDGAYEFDGASINLGEGGFEETMCDNGCSFSAWVKSGVIGADQMIIARYDSTGANSFMRFYVLADGGFSFTLSKNGTLANDLCFIDTGAGDIVAGNWYYVAGTYNTSNCLGYINGIKEQEVASGSGGVLSGAGGWGDDEVLCISGHDNVCAKSHFNGSISDVKIYNRSLSATEIQNLYEQKVKSKDAYGYRAKDNVWYGANTFAALVSNTLNTGQGANELYAMNQDVETTDAVTFLTLDTGEGANELYDMNQNVETTSNVQFNDTTVNSIILDGDIANHKIYDNSSCIIIQAGTTYLEICE